MDTPVRGFVYEASGSADPALLAQGAHIVRTASQTWRIPVEVVSADAAEHEAWLEAMKEAVERTMSDFPRYSGVSHTSSALRAARRGCPPR